MQRVVARLAGGAEAREAQEAQRLLVTLLEADRMPLLSVLGRGPLTVQFSHPSLQEFFCALAICDLEQPHHAPLPIREPWRWGPGWAHTVTMGVGCGAAFGRGLARAAGLAGSEVRELDVSIKGFDKASAAAVEALAEMTSGSTLRRLKLDGEPMLPVGELRGEVKAPGGAVHLSRRLLDDATALVIARCVRGNRSLETLGLHCDLKELGGEAGANLAAALHGSGIRELELDGYPLQLDVLRGETAA